MSPNSAALTTATTPRLEVRTFPKASPARTWAWLAVVVLFAIVYLTSAVSPALQDDADSTHAEAAREMFVSGDYVTLHVNGVRYLEKAPLMYWMVATSYHLFGVNEFATRLPTTLAIFGLALLAMRWGRRAFGARAGVYAGLFVCTTAGYYLFTRILIPEAILSLLVACTLYCFLTALEYESRPWRWYAGYACLALAVLTKGLVALVVVGPAALSYLIVSGDWRRWREFHLPTGLLLFFAVATPWHVLAGLRNQNFFWFYFVNEHVLRFLGQRYPKDYNKLPAGLYWGLHLIWLFPWSAYLPVALRNLRSDLSAVKQVRWDDDPRSSFRARTKLMCWLWAGVVLTFFALSTNQEYYTFPAYLPLLLLLAGAIAQDEQSKNSRWLVPTTAVAAVLSLIAGGILIAGLWASRALPFVPDIGTLLAHHDLTSDTLSMAHMLDLTSQSFAALRLPAILAAVALIVGPSLALWMRLRRRNFAGTWVTACAMGLFLLAAHIALGRFEPYLGSKNLAQQISAKVTADDRVMIYGDQAFGSSLLFYLKRPIQLVNGRTTSMWFGSTYPDAPRIFLTDADLLEAWNSGPRVFLFVPAHQLARVDSLIAGEKHVVGESSGKVVYSNRP
ncbi:MAG TPA: glycosyltransferase family 39 protein [Terriglobales bacterium]|nr:glycosyltransferase family 39 protein [Terriglobales bacterium]